MQRPWRAVWLTLASGVALCAALGLAGPRRSGSFARYALDRALHGASFDVGGVDVRLPPGWWTSEQRETRGTTELRVQRLPESRGAERVAVAIVRHVNFELSRENATAARASLAWESPLYGAWEPDELLDVDLGGKPGLELRYDRAGPPVGDPTAVASDFLLPDQRVWVQCAPMSAEELAQCRAIAASAASRAN